MDSLNPVQAAVIANFRLALAAVGLADRYTLVERVDPEALPPEVVFIDDGRAKLEARLKVREARL